MSFILLKCSVKRGKNYLTHLRQAELASKRDTFASHQAFLAACQEFPKRNRIFYHFCDQEPEDWAENSDGISFPTGGVLLGK